MNPVQLMVLACSVAASDAAGEAARIGRYRLTAEGLERVTRALMDAVPAMVALVEDWGAVTEEQIEGAARDLGVLVLREVLGPPAPEALN